MYKHNDRMEGLMHSTKMNWQTEEGAQNQGQMKLIKGIKEAKP